MEEPTSSERHCQSRDATVVVVPVTPSPTNSTAGCDMENVPSMDDSEDDAAAVEETYDNNHSTRFSNMVVPYVDAKTKAMGVRAELEELRKRSLTKKERSRVLKRLSLSDQTDSTPVSTQEINEFFLQQRERERALRQHQRDSIEYLHHYRGCETPLNGVHPVFAKDNINNPAYSSMSEIDAFSQQQMDLARELKQQKQSALQNIRSFRSSYPLQTVTSKDGARAVPAVQTNFSLDERENEGHSVMPRLNGHCDAKANNKEEQNANDMAVPRFHARRQSYEDKLDAMTRSPYNISPFGCDSSDSSTPSSSLRQLVALTSPYGPSSDCSSSSSSRKLSGIGSQDMDRSETHIFEDDQESVDDYDFVSRSGSQNQFVVLHHSENLRGISLPDLNSKDSDVCLDCSPDAAMLIIRAEHLDSLDCSLDALHVSGGGADEELDTHDVDGPFSKSAVRSGRKSHIVPRTAGSSKRDDGVAVGKVDSSTNASPEENDVEAVHPRDRVSGIVPPTRRLSKQSTDASFVESDEESETDVLSDCDSDLGLKETKLQARNSTGTHEASNQSRDAASDKRRKSNLIFPSVRSSKERSNTGNNPLRLKSLRNIFRLPSRASAAAAPPPSPPLKRVPLYSHHPSDTKREVVSVCQSQFIPDLHKTRDGCERCLYWASADQKEKFEQTGHHFRIMLTRGGCNRSCSVFPRAADEYPVRLCRKCFFDTHQFGKFYTV